MRAQLILLIWVLNATVPVALASEPPSLDELLALSDPTRQTEWATRFEHGEGLEQSYDAAIQLYCVAAWDGNAEAQYQLGWMYANGRGLVRDDQLAAGWFQMAAEQGDTHAQRMLEQVSTTDETAPAHCIRPNGEELHQLPTGESPEKDRAIIEQMVRRMAPRYGLEPNLVLALIQVESNFNPSAHSHKDAQGLMQLIPATAKRFGVSNIKHPVENLNGGMAYLRWLLDHFDGDVQLALAGYNAGEAAVQRYKGIPPYSETQHYVKAVVRLYERPQAPAGA